MRKAIILLVLFLGMSGCGDDTAPLDALVFGKPDQTFTIGPTNPRNKLVPLSFKVENEAGTALPEVDIIFFADGGTLTDLDGNPLNPAVPDFFKTKTDDVGLVRISYFITFPDCGTADQTLTGTVSADVGNSFFTWTGTFTVKQC